MGISHHGMLVLWWTCMLVRTHSSFLLFTKFWSYLGDLCSLFCTNFNLNNSLLLYFVHSICSTHFLSLEFFVRLVKCSTMPMNSNKASGVLPRGIEHPRITPLSHCTQPVETQCFVVSLELILAVGRPHTPTL